MPIGITFKNLPQDENKWIHPEYPDDDRRQDIPWIIAQPNGGYFENCGAVEPLYSTGMHALVEDMFCQRHNCYYCLFNR